MKTIKKRRRNRSLKHPFVSKVPHIAALLFMLMGFIIPFVFAQNLSALIVGNNQGQVYTVTTSLIAIVCSVGLMFLFMKMFKSEFDGFFKQDGFIYGFKLTIPFIAFWVVWSIVKLALGLQQYNGFSFTDILGGIETGFIEEIAFRALALTVLLRLHFKKNDVIGAPIFIGVIFGAFHLLNLTGGEPLPEVICNAIFALGCGLTFSVIYTMSGNIWALILAHGIYDAFTFCCESTNDIDFAGIFDIVAMLVMGVVYIKLLYNHKDDVYSMWQEKWQVEGIQPELDLDVA